MARHEVKALTYTRNKITQKYKNIKKDKDAGNNNYFYLMIILRGEAGTASSLLGPPPPQEDLWG